MTVAIGGLFELIDIDDNDGRIVGVTITARRFGDKAPGPGVSIADGINGPMAAALGAGDIADRVPGGAS